MSINYFFQKHEKSFKTQKLLMVRYTITEEKNGSSNIFVKVLSIKLTKSMLNRQSTRHCCNQNFVFKYHFFFLLFPTTCFTSVLVL